MNFNEVQESYRPRRAIEIQWDGAPGGSLAGFRDVYIMAERVAAGTSSANEVKTVPFSDAAEAETWFGAGSFGAYLARQVFRGGKLRSRVYGVALAESGGVAASQTVTFANAATSAGTFTQNVGGAVFDFTVESGDSASDIGDLLVAAFNKLDSDVKPPMTAANAAGVVTFTCGNKGAHGNTFPVYQITTGEEPSATTWTAGAATFANGTLYPTLTTALANMANIVTPVIVHPWDETPDGSTAIPDLIRAHLETKCNAEHMHRGRQVLSSCVAPATAVTDVGNLDDSDAERASYCPIQIDPSSNSPGDWHGAVAAWVANAIAQQTDPAFPFYNVALPYAHQPPDSGDVLSNAEIDTSIEAGITPITYDAKRGKVVIVRGVNARLVNSKPVDWAVVDAIDWYRYNVDINLEATFGPGTKLAEDGETNLDENTTTPAGVLDVFYETMFSDQMRGVLRNRETLWAEAVAEINASQEGRVDVSVAAAAMMGLAVIAGKIRQRGGVIG